MGRADTTEVLDACYGAYADHDAWARDVRGTVARAFPWLLGPTVAAIRHDAALNFLGPLALAQTDNEPITEATFRELCAMWGGPDMVRRFFYPRALLNLQSALAATATVSERSWLRGYRTSLGVDEIMGAVVHPMPGVALALSGGLARGATISRADHLRLAQIALHIESALRLRLGEFRVRAVIGAKGGVIDEDGPRDARYSRGAVGVERARSTRDLELWPALLAGEVSVVPRLRGARRVYEIVDNAPAARPFRALSKREVEVLAIAARGAPAKLCAYSLGVSQATVSLALASAAAKVGLANRLELIRIAALLAGDPRVDADEATLTASEQAVLALVREGLSNREIAVRRGRSLRTIANQVSALLAKTGAGSRRALVARPSG